MDTVLPKGSESDVLCDRYRRHSIKATTGRRFAKNTVPPARRDIEGRDVVVHEVTSISGARRQQNGLNTVSVRRLYRASTC